MKRLLAKEMRDLAPVALVVAAAGFAFAWVIGSTEIFTLPSLALLCAACGAALGIAQGLLDRRRGEDPFLLHRPVSAVRIHTVRGLVGSAIATTVAALCVLRTVTVASDRAAAMTVAWAEAVGSAQEPLMSPHPGPGDSLACIAGAVVLHAVTRLAFVARRPTATAVLLVVLPTMTVYALLSVDTVSAPWLLFAVMACVATALSSLQLAGRTA